MRTLNLLDLGFADRAVQRKPSDFGSLQRWFRADSLLGSLANNDPVTTWTDEATGNNASGSGSTRPTFKTAVWNGMPAVSFDGVDDKMTFGGVTLGTADEFTIAIVYQSRSAANDCMLLGNDSNNVQVRANRGNSDVLSVYQGSGTEFTATGGAPRNTTDLRLLWYRCEQFPGTFRRFTTFEGSYQFGGNSDNPAISFTIDRISGNGSSGFFALGDYAEICIWKTKLSSAQIHDLSRHYFMPRWGWNNTNT